MERTMEYWTDQYKQKGALWIHDGNPKRPHALLTPVSGSRHSGGYFNSRRLINDEVLLRDAASDLLELFSQRGGDISKVEGVVGPRRGATKLAEFISDQIMGYTRGPCFWASPVKIDDNGTKTMVFSGKDPALIQGRTVLLCEDAVSTGGNIGLTEDSIVNAGGVVLPYVLVLMNRSGLITVIGKEIVSLVDLPMPSWTSEECPLCMDGSKAVPAKDNWDLLNAKY